MRKIDMIVIHCSATRADVPLLPRHWMKCTGSAGSTDAGIIIM